MATILVIDDDSMMRGMIRDMLESKGHEIEEAETSEEGVAKFLHLRPALVITDLFIPLRGGLEIIKDIIAEDKEAKIIAISGMELSGFGFRQDTDPKEIAKQNGARYAFKKPFGQEEFFEAVTELLGD
jgi:CheY-like chemotaxis protein